MWLSYEIRCVFKFLVAITRPARTLLVCTPCYHRTKNKQKKTVFNIWCSKLWGFRPLYGANALVVCRSAPVKDSGLSYCTSTSKSTFTRGVCTRTSMPLIA
ncbi:uncharacterized protein YALI1_E27981g [Yarrowia lipolytica]|uniref:Uncharacterized protein n=1 Tax=Yarrowia lipolytica TaxID=4952 RepID=A0A1D8NJR2_YARLL|nr:hypothetical protein YALI1_E27981g [Yarrowia lipolytica]